MKKLLKNVICESVNNASVEKSTNVDLTKKKKKKKKEKTAEQKRRRHNNLNPNRCIVYEDKLFKFIHYS